MSNDEHHTVSFSGGKDSTAMLLMMLERGMQIDEVLNVDTTKEFPEMYEHIAKVRSLLPKSLKFTRIELPFDYWMFEHVRVRGTRVGQAGYGWPDFRNRWCTSKKIELSTRYMRTIKDKTIVEYHGIAADERHRTANKRTARDNVRHPLVDWGVIENEALSYCYAKGLDWGGLYEKFGRVSCWCCPLSRISELRTLHDLFPELWSQLQDMDERSKFRAFRPDYTVSELSLKFGG